MRKLLVTLSALALSAGAAHAGSKLAPVVDPVITAPAPVMTMPAAMPWAGGYAGLGLSFGRSTYRADNPDLDDLLDDLFDNDEDLDFDLGDFQFGEFWPSGRGAGVGGFAGYNWQSGNLVFGLEAHLSANRVRGSRSESGDLTPVLDFLDLDGELAGSGTVETNVRGMASLRGRVGVAADRTLFFVTAGPAMASVRHTASFSLNGEIDGDPFSYSTSVSDSQTVRGWVIGVGVEHALAGGWNIRGDLEHHRFSGRDFNTGAAELGITGATFPNVRTHVNVARISAVFRF